MNWCCFSSWVQMISVPLLLTCSGGCIPVEVQSVDGFDVFCWWFLFRSWGQRCLALAVCKTKCDGAMPWLCT